MVGRKLILEICIIVLLRHYDNFSAFHEDCAFLCDAFASLAATSESLDQCSVRGLERNANWLKYRIGEFKEDLKQIRSKCSDASG